MKTLQNEPVISAAALAAVISAGLSFARLMNWIELDDAQFDAFMVFLGLLLPMGTAAIARQWVTPVTQPRDSDLGELVRADGQELVAEKELREKEGRS